MKEFKTSNKKVKMRVHNFNAGPAILPETALAQASEAVKEFNGLGMSILEISHRSKDFQAVMDEAGQLVLENLKLDPSYKVLFLQGGASTQFAMVPMNLPEQWRRCRLCKHRYLGQESHQGS